MRAIIQLSLRASPGLQLFAWCVCLFSVLGRVVPLHAQAPYQFTLLAGSGGTSSSINGDRGAATFLQPNDVVVDATGNIYVADSFNSVIRKISPAGEVTTLAGLAGQTGSTDGMGAAARFNQSGGIAVDATGQVYVSDTYNNTIRRISSDGGVTTLAGLAGVSGGSDGPGVNARFNFPNGLCVDAVGNVYIADSLNNTIRKVSPSGVTSTLAGVPGSAGTSDGIGAGARFRTPLGICIDPAGNLFVADSSNHVIRRITPAGEVTTMAGLPGTPGVVDGAANNARFTYPTDIACDTAGNLYVSERNSQTVRRISLAGVVTTVAGADGISGFTNGNGRDARFRTPWGLAVDGAGHLLIADVGNHAIRQLDEEGMVSTLTGGAGAPGDVDGAATDARFFSPRLLAVGPDGNVYVADASNNQIRVISNTGQVSTLAEAVGRSQVRGVAVDRAGNIYATDANTRIYKVSPVGIVTVFAGGDTGGNVDAVGTSARFSAPYGMAVDREDNIYVVDRNTHVIRKITPAGEVVTWVGSPGASGADDGVGNYAKFQNPEGIAVDRDGVAYVTDTRNHTVRRISPTGKVTTLAGLAGSPGTDDGVGDEARFNFPSGIAVDAHGYIYVTDTGNGTLRGISPEGVVTTLGGVGQIKTYLTGMDGEARFANPYGVAVDPDGRLFVSDAFYHTILVATNQSEPSLLQSPASQTVAETDRVVLSVSASGGYVNYQWRKDGVPIPDEAHSTLVIPSAALADAGTYDVVISNLHGTEVSEPATLAVNPIPVITSHSVSRLMITAGGPLNLAVTATGSGALHYQWQRNGMAIPGATGSTYNVAAAGPEDRGWYRVLITDDNGTRRSPVSFVLVAPAVTQVVAWGSKYDGQGSVPADLGDTVSFAAGEGHVLALRAGGTVVAWGAGSFNRSTVPSGLSDVVAVAAGGAHSLALKSDGTVVAWGLDDFGQASVPNELDDVVMIAAGGHRSLALRSDGTVVQWGANAGDAVPMPGNLSDIIAVDAGSNMALALHADGEVTAWGYNHYGQASPPEEITGVVAVGGGQDYAAALLSDGAVAIWGRNTSGELDMPEGVSDAIAISAGYYHVLALRTDGTVTAWGSNGAGQAAVPVGLVDVWSIAAGGNFSLALRSAVTDPVPEITSQPTSQIMVETGRLTLSVEADGVGVLAYQWRKDGDILPGATLPELVIAEAALTDAGDYDVLVYNHAGAITSAVATVMVKAVPVVTAQSSSRQVFEPGDTLNLSVTATGTGALSYQWLHDGKPVEGANGPDLSINGLSLRDNGWYVAMITDDNGMRYSKPMFVIVAPMRTQLVTWGPLAGLSVPDDVADVVDFAAGNDGVLIVRRSGSVEWWGDADSNLAHLTGTVDAVAVAATNGYGIVLKSDGSVVAFGAVATGAVTVPEGLDDVVSIATGWDHGLMLRANGKLNGLGNFGPQFTGSLPPDDLHDVAAIASGNGFSAVMRRDGSVTSWARVGITAPAAPAALPPVARVSAGYDHILGVQDNGLVSAWGANGWQQTVIPNGLEGVIEVHAGSHNSFALKNDGMVLAWGKDTTGQNAVPVHVNRVFRLGGYAALRDATADSAPFFSLQPGSQILTETQRLTLTATATGAGPLTYQWRKNGEPITGANSASFAIEELKLADAGDYTLAVTNHVGTTISASAVVTINAIPVVTLAGPARHAVEIGESVHLEVAATGSGGVTYEWLHNGRTLQGVNGPSLDIPNATMRDNGWYVTKVTDANGTRYGPPQFVLVAPARTQLRAWGTGETVAGLPVAVTDAVAVSAGSNHALAIRRDGTVVAWGNNYLNKATVPVGLTDVVAVAAGNSQSVALKSDGSVVVWGRTGTFPGAITDAVAVAAGSAYGMALRSNGKVVSWSMLDISSAEFPSGLGHAIAFDMAEDHVLALTAAGNLTEWPRRMGNIPYDLGQVATIADGRNDILVLRTDGTVRQFSSGGYPRAIPADLSDVVGISLGDYHALALKADGSITSWGSASSAIMTVPSDVTRAIAVDANGSFNLVLRDATQDALPVITEHPVAQTMSETQRAVFSVTASGAAPLRYQWLKGATPIAGATSATLTLENTQVADSGSYSVIVSNHVGSVTSLVVPLAVRPLPVIGLATSNRVHIAAGQPLSITASATGSGTLHCQWLHNGYLIPGAISATYSVSAATAAEAGWYALQVTDDYGTCTSAAVFVSLEAAPGQIQHWGRWADPGEGASSRLMTVTQTGLESAVQVGLYKPSSSLYVGVALLADGTLKKWGAPDGYVLGSVTDAVAMSLPASGDVLLRLRSGGTVVADGSSQYARNAVPTGLNKVAAISVGDTFALALKTDGTVQAWGYNSNGQSNVPAGLSGVVAISAGYAHALALKRDGTVVAWGNNYSGQTNVPAELTDVMAVSAGNNYSLALKRDGTVVAWGSNSNGESTVPAGLTNVMRIAAGSQHAVALCSDGTVVAWGYNYNRESDVPAHLRDADTARVRFIAAAAGTTLLIRDPAVDVVPRITADPASLTVIEDDPATLSVGATGTDPISYQWRKNGVIVDGANMPSLVFANALPGDAGDYDVVVTNAQGSVTSSIATLTVQAKPVITNVGATRHVLESGTDLVLSATVSGTGELTYQWLHNGRPLAGATTQTLTLSNLTPTDGGWYALRVTDNHGSRVGAPRFVSVVPEVTQVIAWGRSFEGQIAVPAGLDDAIAVSAGGRHSLALRRDGTVVHWGNAYSSGQNLVPPGLDRIVAIWAANDVSFALRDDGTVRAWGGYTTYGRLSVPAGLSNVVDLAIGPRHILALKSDGSVVAWGESYYGECTVPAGLNDVVAVAAADYVSLALRSDGTVVAWGNTSMPVAQVPEAVAADDFQVYYNFALALKSDGTLTSWGSSSYGLASIPVSLSGVADFALSNGAAFAVGSDGSLIGWGTDTVATVPEGVAQVFDISIHSNHALALRDASSDSAPQIATHPASQTVAEEAGVSLSVSVGVGDSLTYQWHKDGEPISGATNATLSFESVTLGDAGSYKVVVTNHIGSVTSHVAVLTVQPLPVVTVAGATRRVLAPGDNLSITATASGSGTVYYQWVRNGNDMPGATAAALNLSGLTVADGGWYAPKVTDANGTRFGASVFVTVMPAKTEIRAWGTDRISFPYTGVMPIPADLSDAIAVTLSSDGSHAFVVRRDGTVSLWGGIPTNDIRNLTDVVMLAEYRGFRLALKSDGTVDSPDVTLYDGFEANLRGVVAVAVGELVYYAVKQNGTVVVWGGDGYGEITNMPAGLNDIVSLSVYGSRVTAIQRDGSIVTWGNGATLPTDLTPVQKVSAGQRNRLFLQQDGTVKIDGSLGYGADSLVVPAGLSSVVDVAMGGWHALALRTDGTLVGWGRNTNDNQATPPANLDRVLRIYATGDLSLALRDASQDAVPVITTQPIGQVVTEGQEVTFSVAATGSAILRYQWRRNGFDIVGATGNTMTLGPVGPGNAGDYTVVVSNAAGSVQSVPAALSVNPLPVVTLTSPVRNVLHPGDSLQLSATATGTGALSYQWYHNGRPIAGATSPGLDLDDVTRAEAGWYVIDVTDDHGTRRSSPWFVLVVPQRTYLIGWGDTQSGKSLVPNGLNRPVAVSAGTDHSIALNADGTVVPWGATNFYSHTTQDATGIVAVAAGSFHTLALKSDGTVQSWGYDSLVPADLRDIVVIAAGGQHSVGLRSDGKVVSWGGSSYLEVPSDATNVVGIAAGWQRSFAVKADGTVVDWGPSDYGWAPVPAGLTDVIAVAAKSYHALALKADGTVVAWGSNDYGESTVPAGLGGVIAIACGHSHSLALKSDGTVVVWGRSDQLEVPASAVGVFQASAGAQYSLVLADATSVSGPVITVQPQDKVVDRGQTVSFAVSGNASLPLDYRWRKNGIQMTDGANVSGTQTDTLTITNAQDGDLGLYSVLVSNELGATESNAAHLAFTKLAQTITFATLVDRPFTTVPVTLSATSDSGLAVSFTKVSGPAIVSGNQLTLTGTGVVTVRATQAGNENYLAATPVERSFSVTANGDSWAAEHFTTTELANPLISGPNADPDGDDLTNLLEYGLGLDPKSSDTTGLPEMGSTTTDWVYTYDRPADRADITYEVEISTDLNTWSTNGVTHSLSSTEEGMETWQASYPLGSASNVFFRLKVEQQD